MATVINMRKARKERARRERDAAAAAARAKHAQSKLEKAARDAAAQKERGDLDGHRRADRSRESPDALAPTPSVGGVTSGKTPMTAQAQKPARRDGSDTNE